MTERRIEFRVSGRVQGVGFRMFAMQAATRLGVDGWVRNRPDGDVEGEAQGPEPAIEQFVGRLKDGPRWGHVARVEVDERSPARGDGGGFRIR